MKILKMIVQEQPDRVCVWCKNVFFIDKYVSTFVNFRSVFSEIIDKRGDIKISSGEIEIEEIFSKKIVFNDDFEIGNQSHTPKKK